MSYLLIVVFSWGISKVSTKFSCLSYIIPLIYFMEQGLRRVAPIPCFQIAYKELILLIGVLHFTEGILTFFFGKDRSEVVITYEGSNIAGGYQSYGKWIVPLLLFSVQGIYIPILAGIIYLNRTFTQIVEEKVEKMGIAIALYGLVIFILDELVRQDKFSLMKMMILMPCMHELLFVWDKILESGKAIYTYPSKGLRLMAFAASQIMPRPFERGDIILEVNGQSITCEEVFYKMRHEKYLMLHIMKLTGEELIVVIEGKQMEALQPVFLPPE